MWKLFVSLKNKRIELKKTREYPPPDMLEHSEVYLLDHNIVLLRY